MPISWAYGLTAVSKRANDSTLERTLSSLAAAGFPEPYIFMDGTWVEEVPDNPRFRNITCRKNPIKIYGNFTLGMWELYIRNPTADLYAMFQDDFVTYKNLRQYLEQCEYPKQGYWNLYTFEQNEKKFDGWYPSNQLGKGAVALVFDRETLLKLLTCDYWTRRPNPDNKDRAWKAIDGGIVCALREQGFKEYVHNPSLVQHTGEHSTLGNKRHGLARTFKGEDFDAMSLVKVPVVHTEQKTHRIGLVGYNVPTGLGEINRQLAKYADIYRWLIQPHPSIADSPAPFETDFVKCASGERVENFVRSVDVVVFAERPYYKNLIDYCKALHKRTVCVPMMEWMPAGARGWPQQVDLFLCPTKYCFEQFAHVVPCACFPWPIDTEHFQFQQRGTCDNFLFVHGHGGYQGRKGGEVVRQALNQYPSLPLLVIDQKRDNWTGAKVLPSPKSNADLYKQGSVLLSPHSVDGLGLEGMEAMACGMPVISTKGKPWDEVPALARINATSTRKVVQRPVEWYLPIVEHVVELCQQWQGQDIVLQSVEAREWAESRAWSKFAAQFNELVRSGKPTRV